MPITEIGGGVGAEDVQDIMGAAWIDTTECNFTYTDASNTLQVDLTGNVARDLLPNADVTYNLGSTAKGWIALYLDNGVTDGGQIYFDGSNVSKLKSTADGATLSIEGFGAFNSLVANNFFSHLYAGYPQATNLGSASYPWKWLHIDAGVTDGGAIYFDSGSTSFLKSTADGLTLNIGGFTTLGFAANEVTAIGSTTYHPLAMHSVKYYLDAGTTNYGYIGVGSAGGAGGALLLNHATSHIGIVTNGSGGVYFSTGHVSPETDNQPDLGTTSKYWKDFYIRGVVYGGSTAPIKIDAGIKNRRTNASLSAAILTANEVRTDFIAHFANATRHTSGQQSTASLPVAATSLATLIALVTEELTLYAAHNADAILASAWAYHNAQNSAGHALSSAVAPTTLAECMARLADIKAKYNAHEVETDCHTTGTVAADQIAMGLETYSVLPNDYIVAVTDTSTSGTSNVILTTASVAEGRVFIVKDESGAMGTNHCDVSTEGSELIDGAATYHMDTNYESIMIYCDGANWFVISDHLS